MKHLRLKSTSSKFADVAICGHYKFSKTKEFTRDIKKVTCKSCLKLGNHFMPNYDLVYCYTGNQLKEMKLV